MTIKRLLRQFTLLSLCVILTQLAFSQTKTISGKISDDKGNPVQGATITARGSKGGTSTDASGAFKLNVPATAKTLVISSVGFSQQEIAIGTKEIFEVSLVPSTQALTDVVVIGYGTTRTKDVTGSIVTVKAKDFNPGAVSAEQLLTGKVPGLQVSNNSGQPGGTTIVKVRGNNSISSTSNPLYVVDNVPIDATSPIAPDKLGVVGTLPSSNGLLFLDPSTVRSITVLKDASAAAIYGARAENGVILIETDKGNGKFQMDAGVSVRTPAGFMKSPDILSAGQYRSEIAKYGFKTDSGQSINAFNAITQNKLSTVYSLSLSGGGENGKYKLSLRASDNQGNILKSGLQQYSSTFSAEQSFLDKRLKLNFNVAYTNYTLQTAPISTNAGSQGNMISAAMNWNPTLALVENGFYNMQNPSGTINPVALSSFWDSYAHTNQVLANTGISLKITKNLTYNFLYGINYASSTLDEQLQGLIQGTGSNADGKGMAETGSATLTSQTITHTLTFDKQLSDAIKLNVLAGYEYYSTTGLQAQETWGYGFNFNYSTSTTDANGHVIYTPHNILPFKYYNAMQTINQANLSTNSDAPSTAELQSYFARAQVGVLDKYFLTATARDDGSNKLGANNKYGVFPSVGFKWDVLKESFMKNSKLFSGLGVRIGWGKTGGTDAIPNPGYQTSLARLSSYGSAGSGPGTSTQNYGNPNLKWETLTSTDGGIDFGILNNRIFGNIDVYSKATTNALFAGTLAVPSAGATIWQNLPGQINNKGFEIGLNGRIVESKDFNWTLGVNVSVNHNKYVAPSLGASPLFLTGSVNGQGVSSAFAEAIANGQPIDVFYLRTFQGFDQNGIAKVASQASSYVGDPNPHVILGLSTTVNYKKFGLTINTHGQFGNKIFNNTLVSVTNLGNIANGKNISKTLIGSQESLANPVSASTRFLQSGNFFKADNVTLSYTLGNIAGVIKNARIYVSAANLFEITKYTGFDAEVNQDHNNSGVPSLAMDYIGYPTFRSVSFGLNFSLY